MNNMTDKKSMRTLCRKLRNSIDKKTEKADSASKILLNFQKFLDTDNVLIYASVGSELGTRKFIQKLLDLGMNIALPKCYEGGIMSFHIIRSWDEMSDGKFGIPEPPESNPEPELTEKTICIVPGLAFTESGERLGYGGGFYDRFFSAHPQLFYIGFTYEDLIVPKLLTMSHDMKVNAIATEERMVLCSAE